MAENQIKLVVVGDGAVGKTYMLTRYIDDKFPTEYFPRHIGAFDALSSAVMRVRCF